MKNCLLPKQKPNGDGYVRVGWLLRGEKPPTRLRLLHRLMYEKWFNTTIPVGMTIDHLCRNRACFNPGHLRVVSLKENVLSGEGACAKHARRTQCKEGHELTATIEGGRERRRCRVCSARTKRAWKIRQRRGVIGSP